MIEVDVLDRLCLGDHTCLVFDDDATRMQALTGFIRAGLRDHHRIRYFGDGHDEITSALIARGVDAAASIAAGQLQVSTPYESYLAPGVFDPEATVGAWRAEAALAKAAGYRGLRVIGDMSWASRPIPGADRLAWYEAQVNRVYADGDAMALCLYDRRLFSAADLQRARWAHPAAVDRDTAHESVPLLRAVRTVDVPGIRLEGEADMSNRHALRAVMEHLVEDTPATSRPLTVDVSGLRYADVTAVRILMHIAVTAAHRLHLVGCSPVLQRLLAFNGAGAVPTLTVQAGA
ncbi:MEDS domain-containing protein [Actinoplanes derwentensis]|uniref:Anti-anti-sigma factor n=1 Tax=Actinoplanes derwentensis TaxID=113562 RepID=A0A1H1VMY7_9ACTN|nr:MEDS domain-containing protein [Actinoplanes derwentensis]GID83659.1 hypothetical protein Ade03nite_25830 [Actinoplanes derwentensis]SDS85646.1 anti-anti-sigma factor [Actinoplanes derwentensis]